MSISNFPPWRAHRGVTYGHEVQPAPPSYHMRTCVTWPVMEGAPYYRTHAPRPHPETPACGHVYTYSTAHRTCIPYPLVSICTRVRRVPGAPYLSARFPPYTRSPTQPRAGLYTYRPTRMQPYRALPATGPVPRLARRLPIPYSRTCPYCPSCRRCGCVQPSPYRHLPSAQYWSHGL